METTTEANQNNRELTTTEIEIAVAQIKDRLMRVAKAQTDLYNLCLKENVDIQDVIAKLRNKYEIPKGVFLFDPFDGGLDIKYAKGCEKYINAFVRGKLSEDSLENLIFYFDEIDECDYGWVLIGQPIEFYNSASDVCIDEVLEEIKSIGTRSRSKNTNLPKLWSYHPQCK